MDGAAEQAASHAWAEAHVDGLGWVGFDVANAFRPTSAMCASPPAATIATPCRSREFGLGQAEERLAVQHHGGAVIQRAQWRDSAGRSHDLLRRAEDRSADWCSCPTRAPMPASIQHLHLPQDACLGGARRARDRADGGRQPRHHAGRRQPARRALQGGCRTLADAARDAVDVPDGAAGREHGARR